MKKIYFALALIASAFCLLPMTANAQNPEPEDNGVFLDKYVTGPDANGQYLITLEAYATGETVESESEIIPPLNIILLIDVSKAMWTNQQPADLSVAVQEFIDTFESPTDPTKKHNISVFCFDEGIEKEWQHVSKGANAQEIQKWIMDWGTNGTDHSQPEYAFERAIKEAQDFKNDTQAKDNQTAVVFFTSTSRYNKGDYAWDALGIQSTVNLSYILKHEGKLPEGHTTVNMYGTMFTNNGKIIPDNERQLKGTVAYTDGLNCKVFSIANFKTTGTATYGEELEVKHFLNFVSSLYPNKEYSNPEMWITNNSQFLTTSGYGTEEPGVTSYHQYNPDPKQIGEMFRKVQKEITEPAIPINEKSVVRDILTPDFQLPEGVSLTTGVKVYTQDCVYSGAPNYTISFNDQRNEITDKVTISVGGDGNRTIDVVGFDFAEHYCGYDEINTVKTPHKGGQKLVITIPIETVADYQGGYDVPTNASGSGIYPADSEQPLEEFDIPSVDFPSIGIIKNGLKKGESATFTIKRIKDEKDAAVTETPFTIMLTGDGTSAAAYTILKNLKEGTYLVTESNWSWTYDVKKVTVDTGDGQSTITPSDDPSVSTKVLAKNQTSDWPEGISETVKCVLFTFTNAKAEGDDETIYSESVVKNQFNGGSVSNPSAETLNSKTQPTESN